MNLNLFDGSMIVQYILEKTVIITYWKRQHVLGRQDRQKD